MTEACFNFNRFIRSFTVLQIVHLKKRPTLTILLHTAWTHVLSVWVALLSNKFQHINVPLIGVSDFFIF